jgi:hypothetical protein
MCGFGGSLGVWDWELWRMHLSRIPREFASISIVTSLGSERKAVLVSERWGMGG